MHFRIRDEPTCTKIYYALRAKNKLNLLLHISIQALNYVLQSITHSASTGSHKKTPFELFKAMEAVSREHFLYSRNTGLLIPKYNV